MDNKLNAEAQIEQICRTCTEFFNETSSLISIFEENTTDDCKFLIIHELILLQVNAEEDDGLPQQICINCIKRLSDIYTFRELCKKSYQTLKNKFLAITPLNKFESNTNTNTSSNSGKVKQEIDENKSQDKNSPNYDNNDDDFFGLDTYDNNDDDDDIASIFSDFFPDKKKPIKKSFQSEKKSFSKNKKNSDLDASDDDDIDELSIKRDILKILDDLNESELDRSKRKRRSNVTNDGEYGEDDDDDDDDFDDEGSNFSDDLPLIRKNAKLPIWHNKKTVWNTTKRPSKPKENLVKQTLNSDPVQQCKECNKYCRLATLKYHRVSCANLLKARQHFSVEESEFHCFYCEEKFDSKEIITDHILNTHPKDRPFQCTFCKEHFPNLRQKNTHKAIHINVVNSIFCQICEKSFRNKSNLKKHMLVKHTKTDQHECKICFKIYSTISQFRRHLQTHGEKLENMDDYDNNGTIYKCDKCIKEFKCERYYKMHMEIHENVAIKNCEVCGKGYQNQKALDKHKIVHNEINQYQCEFCGKQFRLMGSLNSHILIHASDKPGCAQFKSSKRAKIFYYDCPKCPLRFRIVSAFEKHIKMHSENRPYPCSQCNNAYTRSEHLKRHIDKAHLKNRKYSCSSCTLTFMDAYTRNNHERCVHGIKHFPCKSCHKVFKNAKGLFYHEQGHAGIKPYKCNICGEGFPDPSILKGHLNKHKPEEHEAVKAKILAENPIE